MILPSIEPNSFSFTFFTINPTDKFADFSESKLVSRNESDLYSPMRPNSILHSMPAARLINTCWSYKVSDQKLLFSIMLKTGIQNQGYKSVRNGDTYGSLLNFDRIREYIPDLVVYYSLLRSGAVVPSIVGGCWFVELPG